MDFEPSGEQQDFRARAAEFARTRLQPGLAQRDREGSFPRALWRACAEFGVLGLPFPERYGGSERDVLVTVAMMEGLGHGCGDNGLLFGLNAQMWSVQHPIARFGTDEQRERFLPGLIAGELVGAHGMTEPGSGSDAFALTARAVPCDGGHRLTGTKTMVTHAPVCDLAVVFATTNPALGMWGISAFIVERGMPGFSVGGTIDKMGLRTSPMGELVLEDCFVPRALQLGPDGVGARVFESSMGWERSCILATQLGAMQRQLERSIEYANQREQFGQPIGAFQSVSNRIADMAVRLETARLLLYKVAWLKQRDRPAAMEAAMVKLCLGEAFVASSLDALRIHGGYGYATETGIERDVRDALGGTLYSGTSDIQRNIIARHLGLGKRS
ncbi:acyl-CoA dehydrogenase family protein [Paraliomyxa miuraensis]|uniref:acyl-CoA dehydrogenase family protein n=1 Tax=Paraliomyxa miuraensis TaxID=376150 RepID=UPI002258A980|nr:acyl-CoA dehydrogenase family protein [Paraliomyxa miuraensis]MCX4241014.1 acyl-CoA dehydrogenase family protein [Paraliomyxa miuraensis]